MFVHNAITKNEITLVYFTGAKHLIELYLKWLDIIREFTHKPKQTDEAATVVEKAFGNSGVSEKFWLYC